MCMIEILTGLAMHSISYCAAINQISKSSDL